MKVIDIDCIENKQHAKIANQWVSSSCEFVKGKNGKLGDIRPLEAIYWLTTKRATVDVLRQKNLLPVGNFARYDSIADFLMDVIAEVDEVAVKNGMDAKGEYRRPCQVLTNRQREFSDISTLKATPVPTWLIGMIHNAKGSIH